MKDKKIGIIIAIVFIIFTAIATIINQRKSDDAMKDSSLVIATITDKYNTRGAETIDVRFVYNKKIINASFGTYHGIV